MSTIRVVKSVRASERARVALQALDALLLDLKAAFITAEHNGTRTVAAAKLRDLVDKYEPQAKEIAMGKLRRPQRILGSANALRSPSHSPSPAARAITESDVLALIEQVAHNGSYEDAHGLLVIAPRERIATAKAWPQAEDRIDEEQRDEFWQWAYEAADVSINGEMAAHLQPSIVRRQAC
jgi:hypothetical protein